jgi:hypothetical protein
MVILPHRKILGTGSGELFGESSAFQRMILPYTGETLNEIFLEKLP